MTDREPADDTGRQAGNRGNIWPESGLKRKQAASGAWQRVEQEMSPGQQFRLDIIVEASHCWRWQIFEGERLVKQSAPIYACRGDANRAGVVEQWELIAESEDGSLG
jgi:hypothetical protein